MEVDLFSSVAIGFIILLIYHYVSQKYQYFFSKPIPCLKPSFLVGNIGATIFRTKDARTHIYDMYNTFPESKVIGFYELMKPIFMLRDPEVIKQICVKDFDHFMDRSLPSAEDRNEHEQQVEGLFANSIVAFRGQKWKDMRSTLSPAFTGSKIRHMFDLISECSQSMVEHFRSEASAGKRLEYELKEVFSRFCNDVIATVAFGIKVDSLRDPETEFYVKGKELLDFQSVIIIVKFLLFQAVPWLMRKLNVDFASADLSNYFKGIIKDNMKQREVHGIVRNDMIQILMEVRKGTLKHTNDDQGTKTTGFATVEESQFGKSAHSRVWTESELLSQCFIFFIAGLDTVSSCLTFLTYELTLNPDIQQRLYEEITETEEGLAGKSLNYETLINMKYLDMVVSETLRKWPPTIDTDRYTTRDYLLDDGAGLKVHIEKGRSIYIPIVAIHNDPKYFPNPEQFDPERFSEENRAKIVPGTFMPFGAGPRNCIGSRLALMEVKMAVYYLLKGFSLERTEKTDDPILLTKKAIDLRTENGAWVEFRPRRV
ncbi:cytochrome P450 9e2-like [Armigeres subalbatus]|uniref:cytochrome P450 9e2-like n=1 Tax=Armigeres subalbatus TaxID=124917 RepID=UPI002ED4E098